MTRCRDYSALCRRTLRDGALVLLLAMVAGCTAPVLGTTSSGKTSAAVQPRTTATGATSRSSNEQMLQLALEQRAAGEYAEMEASLLTLVRQAPPTTLLRQAQFHLAEAHLLGGHADAAVGELTTFLRTDSQDEWRARAQFLLGRAYEEIGHHAEAIAAYQAYRKLPTLLAAYAAQRQAAQERAIGDTSAMLADYEYAARQPIAAPRRAEMLESMVQSYHEQGRGDLEMARYRDLLALARKPEYRAELLFRAASHAADTGLHTEQIAWLREIVDQHPNSSQALDALKALGEAGQPVEPFVAAQILFWHEQYADAVPQFDAALGGQLAEVARFEARRLRALALRATGDFDAAAAELKDLATEAPTSPAQRQARLDYIQTIGQAGNRGAAIEEYRRFAAAYPTDALAPEALWRAVQIEQAADEEAAMLAAIDLGRRYPKSDQGQVALDTAARYFQGKSRSQAALAAWESLSSSASGWDAAEGHFWYGATVQESGDKGQAQQQLRAALKAAPESYYGARAHEILGEHDTGEVLLGAGLVKPEREAVESWIATWTKRPAVHVDASWLPEIAGSPELLRARELGALDLRAEALDEWLAAVEQWREAPENLWQIAVLASLENQPYVALKAAERIVALSPAKRITPDTPAPLLRLIYPAPHARVTRQIAQEYGLDPRLLYALLRQESLFNPDATSSAGALGLAQVMPATAAGIAGNLSLPDFQPGLLYRPVVGLRFGAYYLARQMRAFDGDIQAAAAAYNGGPGNAVRWRELSTDPDRFTELIDYHETRDYVKRVYGNWGMYRMLYGN